MGEVDDGQAAMNVRGGYIKGSGEVGVGMGGRY